MTKKLCKQLIKWYEDSISLIKKENNFEIIREILYKREISCGICICAFYKFKKYIYDDKWINHFKGTGKYWFDLPYLQGSKEKVILSLQKRVTRLKTFLRYH